MTTSTSPSSSDSGGSLEDRLATVKAGIADAATQAGRDPSSITTIVVTKFHPASLVRRLAGLGVEDVGESRHQEAQGKAAELADLHLRFHFVGQLQSKKARQATAYARVVHSLDRVSVIDALAASDPPIDGFVQLNLTDDAGRGGIAENDLERTVERIRSFSANDLERTVERILSTTGIRLRGVMAVAPAEGSARSAFARVRAASDRLRALEPAATDLSIGMSGDYRDAILEGATHLRIGSAITGNRPSPG